MQTKIEIFKNIKKAALILRAVDNPKRVKMLNFISNNPGSTVTDIFIAMRCEQSEASQNLEKLRNAGFVESERAGKFIKYNITDKAFEIIDSINKFNKN